MNGIDFVLTEGILYAQLGESVDSAQLTAADLQAAFKRSALHRCRLDEQAFDNAVDELTQAPSKVVRIGEQVPAQITLQISDDDMQVHAHVVAPHGGAALSMNELLSLLREQRVTMGILRHSMEKIIDHTTQSEPGSLLEVLIARGRPAVDGADARFEALTLDARERVLQPQIIDGDKVDMRNLGDIISVRPGTKLLRRVPPSQGSTGFTVTGLTLEPASGQDHRLEPGPGTAYCPHDPNVLIATRQGLPRIIDHSALVDDVLTMRKVDATTGHVNYEGSVVISGNIGPGMRVVAGGDITVNGYVDSAYVQADGNITITKGVIGQQTEYNPLEEPNNQVDHSTQIIAQGSIWVSYCQYATLRANKGLIVDKQLTHCHVVTQGTLCLGGEGKAARGKLIGGYVETNTHVYAGQLGAPAGTHTRIQIHLPEPTPEYLQQVDELTLQLRNEIATVAKLQKAGDRAKATMQGDALSKFLATLEPKTENHRRNITVLKIRARELQKQAPERQMIVVHANRVLHSGVIFRCDFETKRIEENRGPSTLILKNGSFSYQYVG